MNRLPAKAARVACAMAVVAVALPACRGGSGVWPFRKRPNVVLISIDTLRADRLPAYGFKGVETPAIDALRRDSILFENAYSHVPLTLPSHATVFTGYLPAENGIRDNGGYELKPGVTTLAETLAAAGYSTGGAVSAIVLAKSTGIARGFEFWDDRFEPPDPHAGLAEVQRPGPVTENFLEEWVASQGKRPFFAFLHLYEPHAPYVPPEPFASQYAKVPYLGEIAAADAIVGRFLSFLRDRRLYDDALVLIVSDHGEGLGEHGEPEHGLFLYRETIRVPVLVKLPRSEEAGKSVARPVGLVDLFPTVLSVAGVDAPPRDGVSLLEAAAGRSPRERRLFSETLYPRLHFGWSDLASVEDAAWHFIEAPRPEVYDLRGDPGERTNLIDRPPDALRALKSAMETIARGFEPPGSLTAERRAQLASLGYLSAPARPAERALRDPKDGTDLVRRISAAAGLAATGRYVEAAAEYAKILREDSGLADLWTQRVQSLFRSGRPDEAIAVARDALARVPSEASAELLEQLAEIYLRRGDTGEALRHCRLAVAAGAPGAEFFLPEIYLARGELKEAKKAAQAAIEKTSFPSLPRLVLARILRAEGDLDGALRETDLARQAMAASRSPAPRGYHSFRGGLLMAAGRFPEAAGELEEERRVDASNPETALELARAYALSGRTADARRTLDDLLKSKLRDPVLLQRAMIALVAGGDSEGGEALRLRGSRLFRGDVRFQPYSR